MTDHEAGSDVEALLHRIDNTHMQGGIGAFREILSDIRRNRIFKMHDALWNKVSAEFCGLNSTDQELAAEVERTLRFIRLEKQKCFRRRRQEESMSWSVNACASCDGSE